MQSTNKTILTNKIMSFLEKRLSCMCDSSIHLENLSDFITNHLYIHGWFLEYLLNYEDTCLIPDEVCSNHTKPVKKKDNKTK